MDFIDIFIPSYHRADNLKTVNYFTSQGYPGEYIHVFIDDEADDIEQYQQACTSTNLHVFNMQEARDRYDYIHRPSQSRRSAGQARNMMYDYAHEKKIPFFMIQDDDTNGYELKRFGRYKRMATIMDILPVFLMIRDFMYRHKIGIFGISQTGDFIGGSNTKMLRNKVMNTTFVHTKYIYRGERGVQDNDTSQFAAIMNEGLFTGSLADGLVLKQTPSAQAKGGLTDLYNECKLLNKSLVVPIQYPSCSFAEHQEMNGGRLHHHILSRYLYPRLIRADVNNVGWDTYKEDIPFTNEPKQRRKQRKCQEDMVI